MSDNPYVQSTADLSRRLGSEDLSALSAPTPVIRKIRDAHHLLARYCALGLPGKVISEKTGYSISRISILRGDPTFQQLVEHYRGIVEDIRTEVTRDFYAQMAAIYGDLLEEASDRIHDNPELMTNGEVAQWITLFADRLGFGPTSKSQNLNVNVDMAEQVAAGRQRAVGAQQRAVEVRADHPNRADHPPRPKALDD